MYNDGVFTLPVGSTAIPQGALVTFNGTAVGLNTADNPGIIGVAVEAGSANDYVGISRCGTGIREVLAGGTITAGDPLTFAANGRVDAYTDEAFICGQAITGGASGDLISAVIYDTAFAVAS